MALRPTVDTKQSPTAQDTFWPIPGLVSTCTGGTVLDTIHTLHTLHSAPDTTQKICALLPSYATGRAGKIATSKVSGGEKLEGKEGRREGGRGRQRKTEKERERERERERDSYFSCCSLGAQDK